MKEKLLTLHTEFVIDSCHQLRGYNGACSRLHGHTWKVDVWIKGEVSKRDSVGILFDFGRVKAIRDKFDHKFINEIPPFDKINATAENLAIHFYELLKAEREDLQFKVRVYETLIGKETYCEYGDDIC